MIKVCSAVYGECMPEFQHKVVFDNWYDCAQAGLTETKYLMQEIGPKVVNRDKITVSFVCKPTSTTWHCVQIVSIVWHHTHLYTYPILVFPSVGIGLVIVEVHHYKYIQ